MKLNDIELAITKTLDYLGIKKDKLTVYGFTGFVYFLQLIVHDFRYRMCWFSIPLSDEVSFLYYFWSNNDYFKGIQLKEKYINNLEKFKEFMKDISPKYYDRFLMVAMTIHYLKYISKSKGDWDDFNTYVNESPHTQHYVCKSEYLDIVNILTQKGLYNAITS